MNVLLAVLWCLGTYGLYRSLTRDSAACLALGGLCLGAMTVGGALWL